MRASSSACTSVSSSTVGLHRARVALLTTAFYPFGLHGLVAMAPMVMTTIAARNVVLVGMVSGLLWLAWRNDGPPPDSNRLR